MQLDKIDVVILVIIFIVGTMVGTEIDKPAIGVILVAGYLFASSSVE